MICIIADVFPKIVDTNSSNNTNTNRCGVRYMSATVRSESCPGGVSGDSLISDGQSYRIRSHGLLSNATLSKITILITNATALTRSPSNAQSETDR